VPVVALLLFGCVGSDGAAEPATLQITALSFNIRWDGFDDGRNSWVNRKPLVAEVIRSTGSDVVGLQEASEAQVRDLLEALPRFRAFHSGERSVVVSILYRADRFRLDRSGAFWLVPESDLSGGTRRCNWVRLVERSTGRAFRHFNFHLDHRSLPSRERSVL
jgi:endonuclease/exonuclease/phosphatase family metal-dependent hydrolase